MMHTNNRLPRPNPSTQLISEVHSLQMVVQEISDLLADREQVIDSLSQEINHLHSRIDQLEQQNTYLHHQQTQFSSLPYHAPVMHHQPQYEPQYATTQSSQPSIPASNIAVPDDFVEQLSEGIEHAITKSLQSHLAAPIVHHVVPAPSMKIKPKKKKQTVVGVESSLKSNDAHLKKKSKPEHAFVLVSGHKLHSIHELVEAIRQGNADWFNAHVHDGKNDFSDWIAHVFKNTALAEKVAQVHTKQEFLALFKEVKA